MGGKSMGGKPHSSRRDPLKPPLPSAKLYVPASLMIARVARAASSLVITFLSSAATRFCTHGTHPLRSEAPWANAEIFAGAVVVSSSAWGEKQAIRQHLKCRPLICLLEATQVVHSDGPGAGCLSQHGCCKQCSACKPKAALLSDCGALSDEIFRRQARCATTGFGRKAGHD